MPQKRLKLKINTPPIQSVDDDTDDSSWSSLFFGSPQKFDTTDVTDAQSEESQGLENLPFVGDYLKKRRLEATKNIKPGDIQEVQGPGMGPGVIGRGADRLADIIDPPDSRENRGTVRPFLAGATKGIGDLIQGGLDPRAVALEGIKPIKEPYQFSTEAVKPTIPPSLRPPKPVMGELTAAPRIAGPSGAGGIVGPYDITPDVAAEIAGIKTGGVPSPSSTSFNPAELAEQNRLNKLDYGQAGQNPGSSMDVRSIGPYENTLPLQSGDISGGFSPESSGPLGYPLDIVPNRLRPRAAQTEIANNPARPNINPLESFRPEDINVQMNDASKMSKENLGKLNEFMDSTELPTNIKEQISAPPNSYIPRNTEGYYNEGNARPGEPQLPSATKNQVFDKPPIDEAPKIDLPTNDIKPIKTASNIEPPGIPPAQEVPTPGNAKVSKDVNKFRAEFGSADKTLQSRSETKPIADGLIAAQDSKAQWIATTERELAEMTAGLSRTDRIIVGKLLNEFKNPDEALQVDSKLAQRALQIRNKLNEIHASLPEGIGPGGNDVGFIENYLTHIEKQGGDLGDGLRQVWEYHIGKPFKDIFTTEPLGKKGIGSSGDMYGTGKGDPGSPFSKTRTGALTNLEMDVNKVLPAYVESIAKLKFDKLAVDAAKEVHASLPNSDLKELAGWYIKNYSKYDAMPGLSEFWDHWTQKLARTTSRSMLGFNTGLQTLHLARIPANLWPEIPTKYMIEGMRELGTKGTSSWEEMAKLGMLSNEIRPWAFKTLGEKTDSIIHLFSTADSLDRAIGYYGFKKMFLDQGMNAEQATMKAIAASKKASLMVDPARSTMGFTKDAKAFGGAIGKLTTQFKQVPTRIVEQYIQVAANAFKDPHAAKRALMGVGSAIALNEAGYRTFHVSPAQFAVQTGGASIQELLKIASPNGKALWNIGSLLLKDHDVEGALEYTQNYLHSDKFKNSLMEAGLAATPAGLSIKRQIEKGPSMFEQE